MGSEDCPVSTTPSDEPSSDGATSVSDKSPDIPHPIPVLGPNDLETAPPLVDVYVDLIENRKLTGKLIKELCAVRPIPSLHHLKRVRNFYIILDYVGEDTPESCLERLRSAGLDTEGLRGRPEVRQVPRRPPRTRRQFEEAHALWPCNFREDKQLEALLAREAFSQQQLRLHARLMERCLQAAQVSRSVGGDGVGALVADPASGEVLAVAYDDRGRHPLKHAVMLLVEAVSRDQGGGFRDWHLDTLPAESAHSGGSAAAVSGSDASTGPSGEAPTLLDSEVARLAACYRAETSSKSSSDQMCEVSDTAASVARPGSGNGTTELGEKSKREVSGSDTSPGRLDGATGCGDVDGLIAGVGAGVDSLPGETGSSSRQTVGETCSEAECASGTKRRRASSVSVSAAGEAECAYLCTGLDVYVTREPCCACAMALLHSRVRRVFYGCANPAVGALGSRAALHTLPGTNHRFQVFRGLLEDRCLQALRTS